MEDSDVPLERLALCQGAVVYMVFRGVAVQRVLGVVRTVHGAPGGNRAPRIAPGAEPGEATHYSSLPSWERGWERGGFTVRSEPAPSPLPLSHEGRGEILRVVR